jgi:hypothetical protein
MEIDPDAKPAEPPPLPPPEPGQWGVGGKDEEGKFAPQAAKKKEEAKPDEDAGKPVDLGPARRVWVDTVIGFGAIRDLTNDIPGTEKGRTQTTGVSFLFGASWRVADIWTLGLRLPFSRTSVEGPAGPFNSFALGNLEMLVRPSFQLTRQLRLPAQISLFFPAGQGDLFPDPADATKKVAIAQGQINMASSAARGWEDIPLFATKRFGVRAGAGITWDKGPYHVAAGTKLDLMAKTGGGDAYPSYTIVSPTWAWTTDASFHYGFLDGMVEPGLRAWIVVEKLPIHSVTRDDSGPQFVLEPQVNGRFPVNAAKTMAVRAGLGVILPVSGPIGGGNGQFDAAIKGFRINAAFEL